MSPGRWPGSPGQRGTQLAAVGPVFAMYHFGKLQMGFPAGSEGKESTCNAGDPGSIPGSGRPPGEGNGYPLQYSCLENPMDQRSLARATVHGVEKNWTGLSD